MPAHRARAVFLDRDGVINVERAYVHRVQDFQFLPGVTAALQQLQQAGWLLVVVTNQSGMARGYYSAQDYEQLTRHMQAELLHLGVRLNAVLHCPHLPDAPVAHYRLVCQCRKPAPGMVLQAAQQLGLDLGRSLLVGDKASDIQAGRAAGVGRCLLVRSGHALQEADLPLADAVYNDLAACVQAELTRPGAESPAAAG